MENNNLSKYRNSSFYLNPLSSIDQPTQKHLPKRIILVRHGESQGNENEAILKYVPNYKIKLSQKGVHQARMVGSTIKDIVSQNGELMNWKAIFYVSPLSRTIETVEEIVGSTFPIDKVVGVREECRLREQHFGNFQEVEERRRIKCIKNTYGKFFYRVPDGESSADVYDRVSTFIEKLWSDMETNKLNINMSSSSDDHNELNVIVVSHGLTILLFLMKWFNWTVDQFEALTNPRNCECRVLELGLNGQYSLAIHHKLEELKEWGLSDEMIEDQKIRASKIF
ncbi:hypothetical protein CASFOL_006351 [Castilleja foliolosa]|uniref:Phosphoglycerate mutase n=1 Tax=Castilleja foliolosa TaxID=1961234 RepID=A0ABD3E649_9LAMI